MLSAAAALLALAAVAACSHAGRPTAGALACAAAAALALVRDLGLVPGLITGAVLAMAAASMLVLVLSPRPRASRPLALACALLGALCAAGGLP